MTRIRAWRNPVTLPAREIKHVTDTPTERGAGNLWTELRHRKVVQWTLAYTAAAWVLLQVLEFAVATFQWSVVITRVAAVLAFTAVPVAITLAWFHGDRGAQRPTRVEIAILTVLLVAGGSLVRHELRSTAAERQSPVTGPASQQLRADRRRIAILPFDNHGGDPANTAFVGGVHDTLITQVAKVPGLSVISRSSVLQFAGKHPTTVEVAAALGVGTVLEGSVERDGSRLRIQAQLIDASTDQHLWAETYDRHAEDLFAVQSEIAQAVAEQLRIRLTSSDAQRLKASLTSKPQAYERYVLGRDLVGHFKYAEAIPELTAAVTIDPEFAAAHAQLGLALAWTSWTEPTTARDNLPLAKASIDRALDLDPTLPEAHLALAIYYYRGEPDMDRAAAEFEHAVAGLPNDALAFQSFALLRRWQQRWEEASALFARAAELDPRGEAVKAHITALVVLGRFEEADKAIRAAHAAQPDDAELALFSGDLRLNVACDLRTMETVLQEVGSRFPDQPGFLWDKAFFASATGDSAGAVAAVDRLARRPGELDQYLPLYQALTYPAAGRSAEAERSLRAGLEPLLRNARSRPPGESRANDYAVVSAHYAMLGDRRHVIEYARRVVADLPTSGQGTNREEALYWSAVALGRVGEDAAAVERLREKFAGPGLFKTRGLWCDPFLAPLRKDRTYRKLMAEQGVDTSVDPLRRETWPAPYLPQ